MNSARELPIGTVTFLFTDIEGSTALLKRLGERYGDVLADHRRILREAAELHDGREIDTQGDSFFFAFARANAALGTAVTAQRVLAQHAWPEDGQVRVRMGLHTGEPTAGEEGYVGLGVHRAARIGALAHGGQVILSSATRELVEDEVGGVSIRELGYYQLKDIDRPERLFQLDVEGLQAEFPPLKADRIAEPRRLRHRAPFLAAVAGVLAVAGAIAVLVLGQGGSASTANIGANSVGAIEASSGELFGTSAVGTPPGSVTADQGSVWAISPSTDSVSRINPKTSTRSGTIRVGANPAGVAVGGGFVWVANGLGGSVSKIDPNGNGGSGAVVDTIPVGNGPAGLVYGAGRVWVANSTDRTVSEFASASRTPLPPIGVPQGADAIAFGFGFAWVVSGSGNSVTRIDARSGTVIPPINVGNGPTSIAVGADAVWVVNSQDGTVSRIDPSTGTVKVIAVGGNPTGIAAGNRVVWVSDGPANTLSRIDPATEKVVQTVSTSNPPGSLATAAGRLYVAVGTPALAHRGGTLTVFPINPTLDSIDPATAYSQDDLSALSMTNDGLVTFQRVGGSNGTRLVPNLATSLPTVGDGGLRYTFQVRTGIHYSSGPLVQPADFRRGIERSLEYQSLKTPLGAGAYFTGIVGAKACVKTSMRCDLTTGIVVDPTARTVIFHLTAPDSDFLSKLALPAADAVPADTAFKARLPLPATGPYMITRFDLKRGVTLARNPLYREWSLAAQPDGYPDRIVYRFGSTSGVQINAVKQQTADYLPLVTDATAALRRGGYGSQLHITPTFTEDFFFLNTNLAPFDQVIVRRAVNDAIDRSRLTQLDRLTSAIRGQPTCQVLPPNSPGYVRYCLYRLDLATARRLVAASGTAGQTVTIPASPAGAPVSRYLASVLQSLGYRPRLQLFKSGGEYAANVFQHSRRYQVGLAGWVADYPSASQFFTPLLTCAASQFGDGFNVAGFCRPQLDREIASATALQISDPQSAAVLWSKVDRDVMQQAPWVPFAKRLSRSS